MILITVKGFFDHIIDDNIIVQIPRPIKTHPSKNRSDENKSYPFGKNNYRTATISTTDLNSLIPILVAAVKEQQQEIENLKAEVNRIKLR